MTRLQDTDACRFALWCAVWMLVSIPGLAADNAKPGEYQVKAAYLYNFGRFVEWPSGSSVSKGDPFTICVLGPDPFGPALDATLAGETIDGISVVPRRVSRPQDAVRCRILFISSAEEIGRAHV